MIEFQKRRVELTMEDQKNLNIRVILNQLNISMEKFEECNSLETTEDEPELLFPLADRM
jgi:hypothetical protein